ncbi:MAG: RDD family protein [Actinomycetota bacterium]
MTYEAAPAAGWYPDPDDPGLDRYFDGVEWTSAVRTFDDADGGLLAVHADEGVHRRSPTPTSSAMRLLAVLLEGVLVTITFGIGWLIWAATTAGGGQTPAKRLLKQRVISNSTDQPAGFATMFLLRGLVGGLVVPIAIGITFGLGLLVPLFTNGNRNLWDILSGTRVVNDPDDAWNTGSGR